MSKNDFLVERLTGSENYHDWCFAITIFLTMKGLKKCIVAGQAEDGQPIVALEKNDDKLDQAQSCLALSVEKSLYVHIRE